MSHELGVFLRARRTDSQLRPPIHGENGLRRVTGLRREEVAADAGISVDYYTRIEQGRETHPSDSVMDALGRALRLEPDALDHLYKLRDSPPISARPSAAGTSLLVDRMTVMVEAVKPNPAYVMDRLSNVIAANTEGLTLFEGFAELEPEHRNTCRYLLTDLRAREVFLEWEELARGAVAHLRAANANKLEDPELLDLVGELRGQSPQFDEWWNGHLVQRRRASTLHIRTRDGQTLTRRFEILHLPDEELRMTIWLPDAQ
jgi:transcriptional regulator with XRE-family HTH domain